ncbi:TLC domain-containing protein [Citrus sinensis]|nr:TLC domain-containing protein [Citrus sinensis]
MDDYILKLVVIVVVLWTAVFLFIRKIFPNRSFNFCSRLVSTIHATLAVTCPVCPLASNSSPRQVLFFSTSWTLAYLIYDLVCCSFDQRVNVDNTIHHLISIVGIGAGLVYEKISSPFLHCREMLKELGYRDTGLNLTADVTFAAIFTFARMVCEPHLTYLTPSARNPIIIKAMALGLQLVSAVQLRKK